MEMFEVGGCVRDEILGLKSKDIDFTVVLEPGEVTMFEELKIFDPFDIMSHRLKAMGFEIFLETREFLTIRARFPRFSNGSGFVMRQAHSGMTADFVLARRETTYSDGRRPDAVEPGTLLDDLSRRDFTMNAIAKDAHGNLIDPFNGRQDIADKVIRAVGNARDRIIGEDALRGLRALRFAVQKGFTIDQEVMLVLASDEFREAIRSVSTERQREELDKMFKVNTSKSMELLFVLNLVDTLFDNTGLRLMPTMKG
jgi:tRNA nucleotidyltransferase/poly(A) polymerase